MKYSEVISRILALSGEEYTGKDSEARDVFQQVVSQMMMPDEVGNDELPGLIITETIVLGEGVSEIITTDLTGGLVKLLDVYADPADADGYTYKHLKLDDVRRISYASGFMPQGKVIGWWRIGKTIRMIPANSAAGRSIEVLYKRNPLDYSDEPAAGYWSDDTEMLDYLSYPFLVEAIKASSSELKSQYKGQ